jgi:cytochrome d ubiquinol oxidase subunit I
MIWLLYWSFRAMVGFGGLMSLIAIVGLILVWRKKLDQQQWFLKALPFAILLPFVSNATGWMLTEVGRQPWIVQGLMRTEQGVSPNLTTTDLWISLIGFTALYLALIIADLYLLWKYGSTASPSADVIQLPEPPAEDSELQKAY